MIAGTPLLDLQTLVAPTDNNSTLIAPPRAEAERCLLASAAARAESDLDLGGQSWRDIAADARSAVIAAALAYTRSYRDVPTPLATHRVIVAGHQAELFHPGVWAKNACLSTLAAEHEAIGINLVVDSDTVKHVGVKVPSILDGRAISRLVDFDRQAGEIPAEDRSVNDAELWQSFGDRACKMLAPLVSDPLLKAFWPTVVERARVTGRPALAIAQARHQWEGKWGYTTLEVPLSTTCETPAFAAFVAHILAHLPRFWSIHNDALAEYRKQYHVRSHRHPFPELHAEGEWLEAPFWIWSRTSPTRRRLYASQVGDSIELTDRAGWNLSLSLSAEGDNQTAIAQLTDLAQQGIRLRTRALSTTLWSRMFLGDLFIHGLGGAKYDRLTNRIIERFFGVAAPAFFTVTGTLHLPLQAPEASLDALRVLEHRLRDLEYNPDRHMFHPEAPTVPTNAQELWRRKSHWVIQPKTPENCGERHQAITAVNAALQPFVATLRRNLEAERARLQRQLAERRLLASREYAFCLHPERTLRPFLAQL